MYSLQQLLLTVNCLPSTANGMQPLSREVMILTLATHGNHRLWTNLRAFWRRGDFDHVEAAHAGVGRHLLLSGD